jgi:hypothetical protein
MRHYLRFLGDDDWVFETPRWDLWSRSLLLQRWSYSTGEKCEASLRRGGKRCYVVGEGCGGRPAYRVPWEAQSASPPQALLATLIGGATYREYTMTYALVQRASPSLLATLMEGYLWGVHGDLRSSSCIGSPPDSCRPAMGDGVKPAEVADVVPSRSVVVGLSTTC